MFRGGKSQKVRGNQKQRKSVKRKNSKRQNSKRKLSNFFKKLLAAKSNKDEQFDYNGNTYVRVEKENNFVVYKKK